METVTRSQKNETKLNVQFEPEKGEIRVLGVRCYFINPVSSCEKVDKIFGTGGEVIVHNVCYESGYELFDTIARSDPEKTKERLLTELVAAAPEMGYGIITITTLRKNPPTVKVTVKNPAAKTDKGSQKHIVGSLWAGILSKYFDKKLTSRDFHYDERKDELTFVVST